MNKIESYSFDDLYEYEVDDFYQFHENFKELLCRALAYLPKDNSSTVLANCLFFPFFGDSWHLPQSLVKGRSVAIIDAKDLENEDEAIVTILHEAGHAFLGHSNLHGYNRADMIRTENECWKQVRLWLPAKFDACIDAAEAQGSGSKGKKPALLPKKKPSKR